MKTTISFILVTLLVLLSACSTAPVAPLTDAQASNLESGEGIVVGSFLVNAIDDGGPINTASMLTFPRIKTNSYKNFTLTAIFRKGLQSEILGHTVEPNKEIFFVKKLPAGEYSFRAISAANAVFYTPSIYSIVVTANKVTYVGQTSFNLDPRISVSVAAGALNKAAMTVEVKNNFDATKSNLITQYPNIFNNITIPPYYWK